MNPRAKPRVLQASPSQLSEATGCVFAKASPVGFTHHLAETVTRIRQVYMNLSKNAPPQLLAGTHNEYLTDFLHGLAQSMRKDDIILRVTGVWEMGAIAALSLMICPEDTVVFVEQLIIHQGSRQNVLIEISEGNVSGDLLVENQGDVRFITKFTLEKPLTGSSQILSPINETMNMGSFVNSRAMQHTYVWDSWLLDTARLRFGELGFDFPEQSAALIASIIVKMHHSYRIYAEDPNNPDLSFWKLLGPRANERLSVFCRQTLGVQPNPTDLGIEELVQILLEKCFHDEPKSYPCLSVWAVEWRKEQLVRDLASLIQDGFVAVFLDPGQKVTITSSRVWRTERTSDHDGIQSLEVMPIDTHVHSLCCEIKRFEDTEDIQSVLAVIYGLLHRKGPLWGHLRKAKEEGSLHPESYEFFGQANDCCVMYPAVLDEMALPSYQGLRYRYETGFFLFQDRRYKKLKASDITASWEGSKSVTDLSWPLRSMGIGRHEQAFWTSLERFDCIELRLDITTNGRREKIGVPSIIAASCSLEILSPCGHLRDDPLSFKDAFPSNGDFEILLVGVCALWTHGTIRPHRRSGMSRIAFSLTQGSREAQLYSLAMMQPGLWRYFLQGGCCMKCATERCRLDYHSACVIPD